MKKFGRSVSFTLRALGLMVAAIVAVSTAFVVSGVQNYLQSSRIVYLVESDRALFEALLKSRLNRSLVQTALQSEDSPADTAAKLERGIQQAVEQGSRTIEALDIRDRAAIIDGIGSALVASRQAFDAVLQEARKPKSERALAKALLRSASTADGGHASLCPPYALNPTLTPRTGCPGPDRRRSCGAA